MSNRTADLDLTGATEAFCARLSAEERSPATIAAYRRDLALVARVAGRWPRASSAGKSRPGSLTRCFPPGRSPRVSEAHARRPRSIG